MKLGARIIATTVIAFLQVTTLFADDTAKRADIPKKDDSVKSATAPPVSADPQPNAKPRLPLRRLFSRPMNSGEGREANSDEHERRLRDPGHTTPKAELSMGYSFWRAVPDSIHNRMDAMHGGSASLAFNLNRTLGLVFDFGGFRADSLEFTRPGAGFSPSRVVDADGHVFSFLFGPRISFRNHDRLTPFLQILGGAVHASEVSVAGCGVAIPACRPLPEETAFAMTAGGGLDYRLNHSFALRLFQAEYLLTHLQDTASPTGENGWQSNVRLSAGIVFRLGVNPPPPPSNHSPVASCSINKPIVYVGSGDFAVVRANASDPDGDPLTYSWTTDGGAVDGNGPEVRWNSSGTSPRTYTVRVRVDDGRGGNADCSADIRVEPQPNRAPTVSCSADHNPIWVGKSVQITATASDPDDDPLTYSWNSSGGHIRGSGAGVKFDSSGLAAGQYAVMGHVEDGRGGTADCRLAVDVRDPPRIGELEQNLDLHSIYFQTARPYAANPNGGLVPSQEQILVTLARDFKEYLGFRPEAHLTLGGHADHRGSEQYNKGLTERRVARTKNFLVENGVPADRIETQSFGEDDNLNADQVKKQIAQNPDLSPDDRQQMLNNLTVMVLANNRRVDVSLSTTGQQSTHRYPFNAKDYLTLISTSGGEPNSAIKKKP